MGGGDRRVTRDLIRNIGSQIESNTRDPLQQALNQARESQKVNIANYTAVEPAYAGAYIAAVEFVTQDWDTKIGDAADIKSALNHLADNWDETEQKSTIKSA
jgi:hypothetical protein